VIQLKRESEVKGKESEAYK